MKGPCEAPVGWAEGCRETTRIFLLMTLKTTFIPIPEPGVRCLRLGSLPNHRFSCEFGGWLVQEYFTTAAILVVNV